MRSCLFIITGWRFITGKHRIDWVFVRESMSQMFMGTLAETVRVLGRQSRVELNVSVGEDVGLGVFASAE
jgi:hypothetical protein